MSYTTYWLSIEQHSDTFKLYMQSLFFCLYYGVGPGISGLAGGYIYQAIGMR